MAPVPRNTQKLIKTGGKRRNPDMPESWANHLTPRPLATNKCSSVLTRFIYAHTHTYTHTHTSLQTNVYDAAHTNTQACTHTHTHTKNMKHIIATF